ncbi:uncharacterized protein LOC114314009 [Camellia sinensis]|uniref:uncharacterized protein LOC114314009 n=1 Tax=Camellia sinensis TaxID=4442 RepID=UPI001036AF86|nr:uncharacterized protein LOC114314009 [Camellia sinensis]
MQRSFPLNDALRLPLGVSKSEQGTPHRRLSAVTNGQRFLYFSERVQIKKLVHNYRFRVTTMNMETLTGKIMELVDVMTRRRVSLVCVQETKWTGEKAREIDDTYFKLYYTGKDRHMNAVGIIVVKGLVENIVAVIRKCDRIMLVNLVIRENIMNVFSGYVPQVGLDY